MTENQAELVGRTFRHFKMRLSPTAIRLADERSKELLHGKSRKSPRDLYSLEGFAKDSKMLEEMVVYAFCMASEVCGCVRQKCSSRPLSAMERR